MLIQPFSTNMSRNLHEYTTEDCMDELLSKLTKTMFTFIQINIVNTKVNKLNITEH